MAMSVSQSVSQGSGIGKLTIIASIERLQSEDHSLDDLVFPDCLVGEAGAGAGVSVNDCCGDSWLQ